MSQIAFNATYNSTLASSQAACVAGATYSSCHSQAVTDGMASGLADTACTDLCRRLGVEAALQAAFPAADASGSTSWITVQPYGAGASPIIDATGFLAAIDFPVSWTGGWKIKGLEIKNAKAAGVHADTTLASGLWLEGLNIHDIDGMSIPATNSTVPQVPGYTNAWPAGVEALNVSFVYLHNLTITATGTPWMIWQNDKTLIDGGTFDTSKYQSAWLIGNGGAHPLTNTAIVGSTITNMGYLGWGFGTASLAVAAVDTLIVDGCNLGNQAFHDNDAEPLDIEGASSRILVNASALHDAYGSGAQSLQGTKDAYIFRNNTLTNVGYGHSVDGVHFRCALLKTDQYITYALLLGNNVTRVTVDNGQKLFCDTTNSPPGYYSDTPPYANIYYGSDNTVTPP